MIALDANDLLFHEGHRITVLIDGPEQTHIALVCEDDEEILGEEEANV